MEGRRRRRRKSRKWKSREGRSVGERWGAPGYCESYIDFEFEFEVSETLGIGEGVIEEGEEEEEDLRGKNKWNFVGDLSKICLERMKMLNIMHGENNGSRGNVVA